MCYQTVRGREGFDPDVTVTYEEFNTMFATDIHDLPEELHAVGVHPDGRVVMLDAHHAAPTDQGQTSDADLGKLRLFIQYWTSEIHPLLPASVSDAPYYFVICVKDGYREYMPLQAGTLSVVSSEKEGPGWRVYHQKRAVFAFSKKLDDPLTVCVPDTYYLGSHGYTDTYFKEVNQDDIPWSDKKALCVWRGHPQNGSKYNFIDWQNHTQNQREEFLERSAAGEFPKVNAGRDALTLKQQLVYKYVLDIDGWVSTWNATAWKMYSGSVMLKVGSIWKQWYYDDGFAPWVHYVPVQNDMSDLNAQIQWCIDHDKECQQISYVLTFRQTLFLVLNGYLSYPIL